MGRDTTGTVSDVELLLPAVRPVAHPVARPRRRLLGTGRAGGEAGDGSGGRRSRSTRGRRVRRRVLRAAWTIVLVLVVSLIWVGVRGAMAVNTLLGATPAFNDVTTAMTDGPTPTVIASVAEIQAAVHRAHGLAGDPVWTGLQHLPVLGDRLVSVRSALSAADILATDGLGPVVALSQTVSFGPYAPGGAGFARLVQASELDDDLTEIADALVRARAELNGVSTDLVVPLLSEPFAAAVQTLDEAADVASALTGGVDGLLELSGYRAPTATVVALLDTDASRPLGGRVERVYLVGVEDGRVQAFAALDPAAVLAAAAASPEFAAAAAGPQSALLADRPADVSQLASTPDAAASLRASVAAGTGVDARAVVLLTADGVDALTGGLVEPAADGATPAGPSLADALDAAAPEQHAGLIDAAVETAVRTVLGLTPRADRLALAVRGAVVGGGLRVWFADAAIQGELAGTRGAGALPATTGQGIPVTVTLDTGGAPAALTATRLTVSAGTCGVLWAARPGLTLDLALAPFDPSSAAEQAVDPAARIVPRVLVGLPPDATVQSVTDPGGDPLGHSELAIGGSRVLVVETAAATTGVRVAVVGRADQGGGLTAVTRGGVPPSVPGDFGCT